MIIKRLLLAALLLCLIFSLTACVPGDGKYTEAKPANFLSGIWHGWIAPVCLVVEIFDPHIRVYERVNTGFWYDFGFYIAVISGFGGVALTRRARRWKRRDLRADD
jgi:hypothetical protein